MLKLVRVIMSSVTFYKINEYSWKACHACDLSFSKVWDAVKEIFSNMGTLFLNAFKHIGNYYIRLTQHPKENEPFKGDSRPMSSVTPICSSREQVLPSANEAKSRLNTLTSAISRWSGFSDFKAAGNNFMNHQWKDGAVHALAGTVKATAILATLYAAKWFIRTAPSLLSFTKPESSEPDYKKRCEQIFSNGWEGKIKIPCPSNGITPRQRFQTEDFPLPHVKLPETHYPDEPGHRPIPRIKLPPNFVNNRSPKLPQEVCYEDMKVPGMDQYELIEASKEECKARFGTADALLSHQCCFRMEASKECETDNPFLSHRAPPFLCSLFNRYDEVRYIKSKDPGAIPQMSLVNEKWKYWSRTRLPQDSKDNPC